MQVYIYIHVLIESSCGLVKYMCIGMCAYIQLYTGMSNIQWLHVSSIVAIYIYLFIYNLRRVVMLFVKKNLLMHLFCETNFLSNRQY